MRKIQRLAAVGAMAALTVALAACGSSETASTGTATSAPAAAAPTSEAAPTSAAAGGVTTNDDVFGAACSMLPQGDAPGSLNNMGPNPVATAASSNPLLTTLVTAVKAAGLVDTLNKSDATYTVYAPANDAFAAVKTQLGDAAFNKLLADKAGLGALLQYHVVGTRYTAQDLITAGRTTELAGGDVTITGTATDGGMKIRDGAGQTATVLCGNIPTSNATVFVIDKVLMPTAS